MPVQTQILLRRDTATNWTSTNPVLSSGEMGFETDTGKFKIGNGSTAWAALAYSAGATAVTYLFNATSGQTTFSGADANGLTLAYTVGAEQVYLNGVLQVRGSDYTATNGTSIVLASGAITGDVLNVIAYSAMTITDTYTQAQANALFTPQANNFFAGKNKIINGDFGVNQRSFTSSTNGSIYTFDRWLKDSGGNDGTVTVSAQTFTPGAAPVAGYESANFIRCVTASQTTTNVYSQISQKIEDVRTFAGQTVTYSFWAKAASGTPKISLEIRQSFGTGGSPSAVTQTYAGQATLSTLWARYSITVTIPSISGKTFGTTANTSFLQPILWLSAGSDYNAITNSLGIQNNTIDIWGVQLEAGSVATPFQTATGTLAGELAACQRYLPAVPVANTEWFGFAYSTTGTQFYGTFAVTPRVAPTGLTISSVSDFTVYNQGFASGTTTAIARNTASTSTYSFTVTTTAGSPTIAAGQPAKMQLTGANGYILFTGCEL